jgi:hypothetical protein
MITARSIVFFNSRTLPGQLYSRRTLQRTLAQRTLWQFITFCRTAQERVGEERNVFASFAQGSDIDGHDAQSIEQIRAESYRS